MLVKKFGFGFVSIFMAVLLSGCYTTGLSMREKGSFNYTNLVYGLYDEDTSNFPESAKLEKPIRLAIAQVGENAPPEAMLNELAGKKYLISKVAVIPAGGNETNYYSNQKEPDQEEFAKKMKKMRNLAKDLGTDYLFLFGGSADYGSSANWLQFFDITLVGGYLIPSNKIKAEGRAAGVLIDVKTGRVIFVVNAEAEKQEHAPTFVAYDRQEDVVVKLRDELVYKITTNFIDKLTYLE
jgi:hypothetical protein